MNVVDSSAWLEYFADGANARHFTKPIIDLSHLIVPSITLFEVFKRIVQQRDENVALQAAALMRQGDVIDLDRNLALSAAKLSHAIKLPMADGIILATARKYGALVWTQDADFKGMEKVRYFSKA